MGVFSLFRRKSRAASETSTAETQEASRTSDTAAEDAATTLSAGAPATPEAKAETAEAVDIPKQQSAGAAADSETGEDAHT
ncbi:hypothetical protein QR77_30990 [Streptomyces sp. 150FB]|nr:hypothetical protein QR77_30990 [Streptomyces sp. 150FB]